MVVEPSSKPAEIMHIDYEVSGAHCLFVDMAKAIYNDGFFNAFYGDLLSNNLTEKPNASDVTLHWTVNADIITIDYNIDVDDSSNSLLGIRPTKQS
ncbi:hypothetical protein ACRE_048050 [Hapsidospora chrysogenum ATCC 11550]|uniref:Uncharacterized protein n=1 Tax=Hapsidospora chrysogenum (strain ATCC 11550 / CBS 779.69 / DSM 880 / IAM 14645 / JCM 23072 / IMI 49137) TaxID=857340 RepID=A0A086T4U4_HAPC1|nr:hypothetical protein ACRE_048050 [Hapsidospora chrysogenum ATCC 11550]